MIYNSYQRYKGGNIDHCNHFFLHFKAASKFLILLVRLILGKVWVDGFIGSRQKIDVIYKFGFILIFKEFLYKQRLMHSFLNKLPNNI